MNCKFKYLKHFSCSGEEKTVVNIAGVNIYFHGRYADLDILASICLRRIIQKRWRSLRKHEYWQRRTPRPGCVWKKKYGMWFLYSKQKP